MSGKKPAKTANRAIDKERVIEGPVEIEYLNYGYEDDSFAQPILVRLNHGKVEASTHIEFIDVTKEQLEKEARLAGKMPNSLFGIELKRFAHPLFDQFFKYFSVEELARTRKKIVIDETQMVK